MVHLTMRRMPAADDDAGRRAEGAGPRGEGVLRALCRSTNSAPSTRVALAELLLRGWAALT